MKKRCLVLLASSALLLGCAHTQKQKNESNPVADNVWYNVSLLNNQNVSLNFLATKLVFTKKTYQRYEVIIKSENELQNQDLNWILIEDGSYDFDVIEIKIELKTGYTEKFSYYEQSIEDNRDLVYRKLIPSRITIESDNTYLAGSLQVTNYALQEPIVSLKTICFKNYSTGNNYFALTDSFGCFYFPNLPAGKYNLLWFAYQDASGYKFWPCNFYFVIQSNKVNNLGELAFSFDNYILKGISIGNNEGEVKETLNRLYPKKINKDIEWVYQLISRNIIN